MNRVMPLTKKLIIRNGKKILAVDFGQTVLHAAILEAVPPGIKLLAYGAKKISSHDERSQETAQDFFQEFSKKNFFATQEVVVNISRGDCLHISHLSLPDLPEEEIPGAIKWQLKEEVPFDLEQAVVDWQVLNEQVDEEGLKKQQLIVVAAERQAMDSYWSTLAKSRLRTVAITHGFFNYGALLGPSEENQTIAAVLEIHEQDASLGIYDGRQLIMVRKLPFSLERLTAALTEVVVIENGKIALSHEEAEEIVRTNGILDHDTPLIKGYIPVHHLIALMRPVLEALIREIHFSYNYFMSTFDRERPTVLYVTGSGAGLKNILPYLSREVKMKVQPFPLPVWFRCDETLEQAWTQGPPGILPGLLGSLMVHPQAINLIPREIRRKAREILSQAVLRICFVAVAGILFLMLGIHEMQIRDYQNRIKIGHLHFDKIKVLGDLKRRIEQKETMLKFIRRDEVVADGLLKSISRSIPAEIVLREFSFGRSQQNVLLKGIAMTLPPHNSEKAILNFIKNLEESPFFAEVDLVSSVAVSNGQDFEISCELSW